MAQRRSALANQGTERGPARLAVEALDVLKQSRYAS
jgi:hypothetical protein